MTGPTRQGLLAGLLQALNVAAAVAWWRLAPGPAFELGTGVVVGVLLMSWLAAVIARRAVLDPRSALWIVGLGVSLPFVWMTAMVMTEVTLIFAITTFIFGVFFVALCPFILWGAFLLTHLSCIRLARLLASDPRAAEIEHAA